ncbi:hypothetical protein AQF52_7765 [Streptomyces venezuelae]|uniref:eCIS core domain-containing protein n=1 Tax=Streptomyces gardneri TaxID=66892 RepID=UPI0006BC34E3|nr:DUF4157 domain-containing protein [Streptomyces gardneri]ALO13351.1 hypothetical protein AQF52_7765 [Streptomyces venezuelae]QPK50002.1 DUF4157 domain-containing protein [Streptomyces gardneri]WRK41574.1 DUF4157 domain-containing protein [Streptomyces venezuelae]CUM35949.1 hypothetical protein BN2537_863 [Streptomyces venezuelae]
MSQQREPHQHENNPAPAKRAPTPSEPAGTIPSGLAALQRSAGNAAVLRMLQLAGHSPAQPQDPTTEQHQHGEGCGHRQAAREAPVQRSPVHKILSEAGRPLDGPVRADMEARLGAEFSDVRIHDDQAARASATEIGARAYTSGHHIVIGDGGNDQHTLAHELTHVIQQRRGSVAGTDNGEGLRVSNPADRYEREAEANATRVMSGPAPSAPAVHEQPSQPLSTGSVQRALVTQISSQDGLHASEVHFAGRPDSPYSDTMGDHSTAFVVQQQAVKSAIVGKTPQEAFTALNELAVRVGALPSTSLVEHASFADYKKNFKDAEEELTKIFHSFSNTPEEEQFSLLQKIVDKFLHWRELVPFSTMKINTVTALAGKGKAESHSHRELVAYAEQPGAGPAAGQDAIFKLLDSAGVAMVATEHDAGTLARLAPGMPSELASDARIRGIVDQHIASIDMAFPGAGVIERAYGSRVDAQRILMEKVQVAVDARRGINRSYYRSRLQNLNNRVQQHYVGFSGGAAGELANLREEWESYNHALVFNGADSLPFPDRPATQDGPGRRTTRSNSSLTASSLTFEVTDSDAMEGVEYRHQGPQVPDRGRGRLRDRSQTQGQGEDEGRERQYVTSQIEMENGRIVEFRSEGRPPSPLSGTMGAHTTAWIAHIDSIRTRIVGMTLDEAVRLIGEVLRTEAAEMELTLTRHFSESGNEGVRRTDLLEAAKLKYQNSLELMSAKGDARAALPLFLQETINALLEYINNIPGATLEAADTGGKSEGITRRKLREYEAGIDVDERLDGLIMKLLDVPKDLGPDQLEALAENHLAVIQHAYPLSYYDSGITVAKLKRELQKSTRRG